MLEPAVFTVGLVAEVASVGETLAKIGCVAGAAEDAVFSDFQGAR